MLKRWVTPWDQASQVLQGEASRGQGDSGKIRVKPSSATAFTVDTPPPPQLPDAIAKNGKKSFQMPLTENQPSFEIKQWLRYLILAKNSLDPTKATRLGEIISSEQSGAWRVVTLRLILENKITFLPS